ncbi:hypothetical protein OVA03_06145 [Asticcacaulis sp. SL142]|uniref:hypothetical protein n=1 Tax=Asticcacaulis sp. SL142 TaxID=2995155 RepID=UPI00226CFCB6|nr:hypothetical protein [Asticcacaulis sp. SL142]WAC49483.1 hypothetical protein OVA03_06145 [Asticcacaulis sp. SL142]
MRKVTEYTIATLLFVTAFAIWYAVSWLLWHNGDKNPNFEKMLKLAQETPVPESYVNASCRYVADKADQQACRSYLEERYKVEKQYVDGHSEQVIYLTIPHKIPDEECALMSLALRDNWIEDDGNIYENYHGALNCDFSKHGLKHIEYKNNDGGYVIFAETYERRVVSKDEYELWVRNVYVTRPRYTPFKQKAYIEYGYDGEAGSGSRCFYERIKGEWRKSGDCVVIWES